MSIKLIKSMKNKRLANGMSLRALSKHIGVSFSSLARMERGEGLPNHISAAKIQHWLGEINDQELAERIAIFGQANGFQHVKARLDQIDAKLEQILILLERSLVCHSR
jgi:transcriptional regulator with XRE-family HTH domain